MSCKNDCGYPIKPAPFAPADPGPCGPCKPGPRPGPRPCPPPPPPCPPSQYVGARYVPKFADPIEWDGAKTYENLIIVTHNNESYTSRCPVPPGIDITNERYWAKTGAYNAQLEQLKEGVNDLSSQVTGFAQDNKEFRAKIEQYDKDNAEMKNTVAKNDARVDNLAERVATAETEIDGLQATTAQHTTEIADLHAKDEDLQRQITSNDNDISAIQAKDVQQDSRLDGIDTKLKSHDATLAQNTADIAKNTKNIQDNAAAIAVNAHELADHAEELKDHEARLTAQHKEITDNHTAIERNTSDIASLRSDLTEDEAKIEANRDAIAHIQEKDVQQDGRLDKLEECCTQAKAHLTQLDTKTDATNTALSEEIDRAKAAELANGKLIAKNAAELATHATELADHEGRIAALEGDNTTNKQDIADIKAKNTAQDTAISAADDKAAHAQETATAAEGKADANEATIGNWNTTFPGEGETVAKVVDDVKTKSDNNATAITEISSTVAGIKGDYVTNTVYQAGQKAQDDALYKLTHLKAIAGCGCGINGETAPQTLMINCNASVETAGSGVGYSGGTLHDDAVKAAEHYNAIPHTNFVITGLADSKTDNQPPIYTSVKGTLTGDFTVVDTNNGFAMLSIQGTVTEDVPEGYNRPTELIQIGGTGSLMAMAMQSPIFPSYYIAEYNG